jgi:hypothetical protein
MSGKKGAASLGRPTARHATFWVYYSGPKTQQNPRGRYRENTGILWTEDRASRAWKRADAARAKKEREWKNAQDGIAPQVIPSRLSFAQWCDVELKHIEAANVSENYKRQVRSRLEIIKEWFGATRPAEITRERIRSYQDGRRPSVKTGKTVNQEVSLILRVLSTIKAEGNLAAVPSVDPLAAETGKREYVPTPKLDAAFKSIRETWPEFADFAEAFFLCGLRPKALGRITVEMVKGIRGKREIHVPADLMKKNRKRAATQHRIPVDTLPAFKAIVDRRLADPSGDGLLFHDGHGKSLLAGGAKDGLSNRATEAWRAAATRADLPAEWGFYGIRGCFNTRALTGGASQAAVDAAMSHIRDEVTDAYLLKMAELVGQAMLRAQDTAETERKEPGAVLEFREAHTSAV